MRFAGRVPFLDRLFGTDRPTPARRPPYRPPAYPTPATAFPTPPPPGMTPPASTDEAALERYRYLLRTAPPAALEQVHAEAFAKLTVAQRQQVLRDMSAALPSYERPTSTDPRSMARAATRAEYMKPGFMERTIGRQGGRPNGQYLGAGNNSPLLGAIIGFTIGSTLAAPFIWPDVAGGSGADVGSAGAMGGDAGGAGGGDFGSSGDFGGGFGDFGF